MSTLLHTTIASPIGDLLLVGDRDGGLHGLYMQAAPRPKAIDPAWTAAAPESEPFASVADQLERYFAGERTSFDLELRPRGNEFQLKVWEALTQIPYGTTTSYGELARRIGHPDGARAVGLANGQNPISVIVPCHRVIGADGKLVGYGGGLERKRLLLELEGGVLSL
jgi:methylated-DNA-[protein]-cysteine S-methyltransferase